MNRASPPGATAGESMRLGRIFLLSVALLAAGCAYLDSIPYSPGSVNDVGYGGRFRQPASG